MRHGTDKPTNQLAGIFLVAYVGGAQIGICGHFGRCFRDTPRTHEVTHFAPRAVERMPILIIPTQSKIVSPDEGRL